MKLFAKSMLALAMGASLVACGGGGGGGGSLASGGISGTGSGTITSLGSIILNGRARFETGSAVIRIDDNPGAEGDLKVGMVVEVDVENSDDDFATGTATQVLVNHEIKGPVTATSPLQILGQPLVITGNTIVIPAAHSFQLGDEVEVSGQRDNTGVIQVSRLEDKAGQLAEWKVMGNVSSLSGNTFNITNQAVDFSGITVQDCVGGLANGDRVEVKVSPKPSSFSPGDTLVATEVECKPNALNAPANITGTIQGEFEGFVTAVDDPLSDTSTFTLGNQRVTRSSSTIYEGGTADDLVVGVKLDAKGIFNTDTGVLDATRIRFRETRFRIQGPTPVPAPALDANTITMLGKEINITALTDVDADAYSREGVEVRGFVDSNGDLFATEVDDESDAGLRLRGRVDNGSITASSFTVLGITVDMDSVNPITGFRIEDTVVNRTTFEAALDNNSEVDAQGGTLSSSTLSGAVLTIENDD